MGVGRAAPRRIWWYLLLVSPGLWVLGILVPSLALRMGEQLTPLLAAAPAIACAGSGRRMCVAFGCACAVVAFVPPGGDPGELGAPGELGERIGTASAVLAVTFASYFVVRRRIRMQRAYAEVQQIAEVTQRVLLRPIPERIGPVATAVEYLSAATGAHVGGDFYEVIDTPYGVRAILGDMRGNGLDAVSGAAALLGAFREAGAVEPTLEGVAVRLDAALIRHAAGAGRGGPGALRGRGELALGAGDEASVWIEDFATAVLVQVPGAWDARGTHTLGTLGVGAGAEAETGVQAGEARLVNCGHPSPYLMRDGQAFAIESERLTLPLGLGSLAEEPYAVSSHAIAFEPGDALVLYTDGVSDARGRSGEFFPLDGLLRGLDGSAAGLDPRAVAVTVRSELIEHMRGELDDDAALLVLGRLDDGVA